MRKGRLSDTDVGTGRYTDTVNRNTKEDSGSLDVSRHSPVTRNGDTIHVCGLTSRTPEGVKDNEVRSLYRDPREVIEPLRYLQRSFS